jgi:predicted acetyltransferase
VSVAPENLTAPLDPDIRYERTIHRDCFPSTKHTLRLDGEAVSWIFTVEYDHHFGPASLRMGGISGVATPEQYRGKGYSRRCLENANRWMRKSGFDVAMLYGIGGDFYPKFGYVEAFPDIAHLFRLEQLRFVADPGNWACLDYSPEKHAAAVLAMYQKANANISGPAVRPKTWRNFSTCGNLANGRKPTAKVFMLHGKPAAYWTCADDLQGEFRVMELGWAAPAAFPGLLHAIGKFAASFKRTTVFFHQPNDLLFTQYLVKFGTISRVTSRRDGGAMVRVINAASALSKLTPILTQRFQPSLCGSSGALRLRTAADDVRLTWRNNVVSAMAEDARFAKSRRKTAKAPSGVGGEIRLTQQALAQLLFGYRSAEALAAEGSLKGFSRSVRCLSAFFPVGSHWFWHADYF